MVELHCHAIKNKNRNHSIKWVKPGIWMIYIHIYIWPCHNLDPCWCPSEGHQHGGLIGPPFECHITKTWKFKSALLQNEEPCWTYTLQNMELLESLTSDETNTSEGWIILYFEKCWCHMNTKDSYSATHGCYNGITSIIFWGPDERQCTC